MKINIGIIGTGRMGITHHAIINSHPDVEVVALCDSSKSMLKILSENIGGFKTYTDYNEMLAKENLQGVVVSTPPEMHRPIIEAAYAKNISVFVEKPFTTSYEEALSLAELAKKQNAVNQVGYVNRFNDMFIYAKKLVAEKLVGDLLRFRSEMFSFTISKEDTGEGWRGKKETGGGCLNEMASHALDLVNYVIGVPDRIIGSTMSQVYSKHVDDIVSSTMIYNNGIIGHLYVNWCDPSYRKPSNKLEIFGKDGKILVDQHGLKVFLKEEKPNYKMKKGWNTIYITDVFNNVGFYVRGNEFTRQLYHFVDNIKNPSMVNTCTFADAAHTQKLLNLIREDAAKGV